MKIISLLHLLVCIRNLKKLLLPPVLAAVLAACANPVAPTGGPRDEDPPRVIRSTPDNYSTNYQGQQVRIFFDEFVQLRDLNRMFLISPPLEKLPEVRIRGRSIMMDINEELRPNTTYNFFFGDAIADITEGNKMLNFQFVVSTGDYVDSLSVQGRVLDALSHKPMEEIYVMLYEDLRDSMPYLERPVYLAKTAKDGTYRINNMREGQYRMFALQDLNANFLYDLPNEAIAFYDSLIRPAYLGAVAAAADTLSGPANGGLPEEEEPMAWQDPDQQQPLMEHEHPDNEDFYTLYMFQEPDTVQRVLSSSLLRQGLIQILFRIPADSAWVRELRQPFEREDWHIAERYPRGDTLHLWLKDVKRDSLFLEVGDGPKVLDTLKLSTTPRQTRARATAAETLPLLGLTANASRSSGLPFFRQLKITATNPVASLDTTLIELWRNDSIPFALPANLEFADNVQRVMVSTTDFEPGLSYSLLALPGAFTDIFGLQNDTLRLQFRTTQAEDYGMLLVDLQLPHTENNFLLQLLSRDGNTLEQRVIRASGLIHFRNLPPGQYGLRLIDDRNNNGKWDTGHYLKGRQPEAVFLFDDPIQLRANWEMEISWSP